MGRFLSFRVLSLPGLALAAFALAIVPLVLALLTATVYTNRLSTQGQVAIKRATLVANASQQLSEALIGMERSARQYNVLLDEELFNVYLEHRSNFLGALAVLQAQSPVASLSGRLHTITTVEAEIYDGLQTLLLGTEAVSLLLDKFSDINAQATVVKAEAERQKDAEVDNLQASAQQANNLMLWQLAGLVPVLGVVAYLFVRLLLNPIGQLDRAIRRLGNGQFDNPVQVRGPSDIQELGTRLEWMRQRIQELENQKTLFLQHMSHELKTPLSSLREGSELLSDGVVGELNHDQAEVVALLKNNCLRLQEQIENLLRYSTAQSHQLVLNASTFWLDQLLDQVIAHHLLVVKGKQLQLSTDIDSIKISADEEKLSMVFDNLLSNAVKFAPDSGTVTMSAKIEGDKAVIEVHNTGGQIPANEHEQVFEAFFQGTTKATSAIKGSGIGLSVCKAYVQLHRGEIFVKPVSSGACLCVTLPMTS